MPCGNIGMHPYTPLATTAPTSLTQQRMEMAYANGPHMLAHGRRFLYIPLEERTPITNLLVVGDGAAIKRLCLFRLGTWY
jgi:hypothetical protein